MRLTHEQRTQALAKVRDNLARVQEKLPEFDTKGSPATGLCLAVAQLTRVMSELVQDAAYPNRE